MGGVKLYVNSKDQLFDFDVLAQEMNYDVGKAAYNAITVVEPYQL